MFLVSLAIILNQLFNLHPNQAWDYFRQASHRLRLRLQLLNQTFLVQCNTHWFTFLQQFEPTFEPSPKPSRPLSTRNPSTPSFARSPKPSKQPTTHPTFWPTKEGVGGFGSSSSSSTGSNIFGGAAAGIAIAVTGFSLLGVWAYNAGYLVSPFVPPVPTALSEHEFASTIQ